MAKVTPRAPAIPQAPAQPSQGLARLPGGGGGLTPSDTPRRLADWGRRLRAARVVVHVLAEDGARLDVLCGYQLPAPESPEFGQLWQAIAAEARSEAQALGQMRLYMAVGEAQDGSELPGGVRWREPGGGRLEAPTITGVTTQLMRHAEAKEQQTQLANATTFRILAEENQRTRKQNIKLMKRIRQLERDRDQVVTEREELLSKKADRIAARKLAAEKAATTRELVGQGKILLPMIAKAVGKAAGIELPVAPMGDANTMMTRAYMESLTEEQFHKMLAIQNPMQAQFFIKAYEAFREDSKADEAEVVPDVEADEVDADEAPSNGAA